MPTADPVVTDKSTTTTVITPMIWQSMPDSEALDPVSGKSHSKEVLRARPVWIAYWIARVKSTAPPINQPITPTENARCSAGRQLNVENKDKGLHSDDEEEPRPPNMGGQKRFPPQVKAMNMI